MVPWVEFAAAEPALASAIRDLFHQYGPGLGYLATVRADGGPRVHPVSPVITDDGLYCFLVNSPKRRDHDRQGVMWPRSHRNPSGNMSRLTELESQRLMLT